MAGLREECGAGRGGDRRRRRDRRPTSSRSPSPRSAISRAAPRSRWPAPGPATSWPSAAGSAGPPPASPCSAAASARRCRSWPRTAGPSRRTSRARARPTLGATAMTDVSDGLVADLGHIAAASGVRIDLRADAARRPGQAARGGRRAQRRPDDLGADRRRRLRAGRDVPARAPTCPTRGGSIGAVAEGEGVRVDGRRWPVGGHEHFR